jgi:aminopeptidase N
MTVLKSICLSSLAILFACNSAKKTTPTVAPVTAQVVAADTAKKTKAPAIAPIYRASNPRTNDLLHTKLEVEFNWTTCRMNGKASLLLKAYLMPTSMLYLNAKGMDILSLEVFERSQTKTEKKLASSYIYENDSLKIYLGREFKSDENYEVVISYIAKPNELKSKGGSNAIIEDKGLYFINPTGENPYKMPQIWTQGETQASSVWFPTIDSPNERATQEIYMTVNDKFTTLSNGLLVESKKLSNGMRLDHWNLDQPHAPYLAMMAVGMFKKVTDEPWNGKEVSYYVDAEYEPYAKEIFGETKAMIDFYSNKLGVPYAWPKYAQIVARDYVSGAMENTSATLHGDFMVYQTPREMLDGKKGTDVIAHELFHQWFGDLVTCESWSNLPLNESFATYGEYLWLEHKNGRTDADEHSWRSRQGYMMSEKDEVPIRFHYRDKEDMFDGISYNKGGQILHMLRKAIGDEAFFGGLKLYLQTNQYKSVEIHNLRLAMEEVSGQDLNWFFNQWFLSKGRPSLKFSTDLQNGKVRIITEQLQDLEQTPLYRLPLQVDLYANGKSTRTQIVITNQIDTFYVASMADVQFVNIDSERQLLADIDYKKTKQQYMAQYKLGPLFLDRFEALSMLENELADNEVYNLFIAAAKSDESVAVRRMAIARLDKSPADKAADLKKQLSSIYQNDKNTTVRSRALSILNKQFASDVELLSLNAAALLEQSYGICAEALMYLAKNDQENALNHAKRFEQEPCATILVPVASVYAERGTDAQLPFFHNGLRYVSGFDLIGYMGLYTKLAKKSNDASAALNAAMDMEVICKGANKFVKYAALKGLKDLKAVWEGKAQTLTREIETLKAAGKSSSELEPKQKEARETADIIAKKIEDASK